MSTAIAQQTVLLQDMNYKYVKQKFQTLMTSVITFSGFHGDCCSNDGPLPVFTLCGKGLF
jgi:hypothetical protein